MKGKAGGGRYYRVMGTLWRHRKAEEAGDAALGLLMRIWSFCADQGEPLVSKRSMCMLMAHDKNGPRKLKALLESGLLEQTADGYIPHDVADHNPILRAPSRDVERDQERESNVSDGESNVTVNVTRNVSKPPENNQVLRPPLSRPRTQEEEKRDREPPTPVGFSAERQHTIFVAAFEQTCKTHPGMGGRNVGGFHASVLRTAELRKLDPERLFRETLATWLARSLTALELKSPYACFCQAWGELTSEVRPTGRDVKSGPVRPAPGSAFTETPFDKIFGPLIEQPTKAAGGSR